MIKILHLSDIHMGSGFSHGRMNPATGFNTRLEDFVKTLSRCIDRALEDTVDLVIFGGDAFPDATPAPYVQEAFASQFRRLVDADIPTVLLVGNHDQHSQGVGGASLNIYRTLGVRGFVVGDTLTTHNIETRNGKVQVITLPWLTRSTLMTRQETEKSSLAEVNELLTERLQVVLEGEIRRLDPDVPTVLLAHLMADNATLGAERFLAVGKGFTLPLSLLTRPCFDYVALGHVHRHQNLNKSNNPPVIYPGSIERVDFSEEKEDKGYVMIELKRGSADWEFCPLPVRTFRTIEVDISKAEDPQAALMKAIAKYNIEDAVVRLIYKLRSEQMDIIDSASIHTALTPAHNYTIQAELVSQLARPRIPELTASSSIDPRSALKTYLNNREDLTDIAASMLEAAEKLLANDVEIWLEGATIE
ncbi:exonuclease subunit SbcD [Nodularia spumigena]|jgi:DNA repair protein SbcD/Mre11|uniref:Nuclease SbcCD subunit D n=2 Tax=Nodularia spumigena TaxID=70799 RepID=A0A2S0QAM8_NODSP|nr:exonuclease SbcCD subunit D [Nodularia spumigena]AVZ31509.1 nuclease SbcCD subunit D [Nodularia spumigena UHCC 0039]MEA5527342.1 exonuclease SbcCD subunit D [Nodularia spumigena UHCC 0143]MEA5609758.1 exonuclease SbcCD subunit D [Nodularia spumigena UHCC 0060]MEA5612986.1 exonuclease SbcCD subunit D [Nodularia spumigena UHCC 0040]